MLPFTADVLFSSFAQYHRALWPLPILAPLLALALLVLTVRPVRHGNRAISALLALAWLWVGIGYFVLHFAAFDFAAPGYGLLFVVQGLLLLWTGVVRGRLAFRFAGDLFDWCGLVLALAAALAGPLGDWLWGRDWAGARVVGLAPGRPPCTRSGCCCSWSDAPRSASQSSRSRGPWSPAPPPGSWRSRRTSPCRQRASAPLR